MDQESRDTTEFVQLFTDGGCSGNPGPGGWAYILKHPSTGRVIDAHGAEVKTTNNRMELTGAIEGLAASRKRRVELITDSQYVGAKGSWTDAHGSARMQGPQGRENLQARDQRGSPSAASMNSSRHGRRAGDMVLGHNGHPGERLRPYGRRGLSRPDGGPQGLSLSGIGICQPTPLHYFTKHADTSFPRSQQIAWEGLIP